jgi:tetratricopeptide (TPR) repeat protein
MRPESEWDLQLGEAELDLRLDDPAAAERRFGEVLLESQASGAGEAAERARIGLALAAMRQGRHEDAVEQLERAFAHSRPPVVERPDVYTALGRSYAALGETPRAVALFRRCLDEISAAPMVDPVLFVRFASYLSYALMDVGDDIAAHEVLADALRRADGVEDPTTLVRLYWSLGRYYSVQGPPARALDYFRRAVALLEATEDRFYLARAHEACATILLDQASDGEASAHLEVAERLFRELAEPAQVGSVKAEWARLALKEGDLARARAAALEALDLLEIGPEPVEVGRAWHTLADVLERVGDLDLAERAHRTAIDTLLRQGASKHLSEAYRGFGKFLRAQGREQEALDTFERAADLAAHTAAVPRLPATERTERSV